MLNGTHLPLDDAQAVAEAAVGTGDTVGTGDSDCTPAFFASLVADRHPTRRRQRTIINAKHHAMVF